LKRTATKRKGSRRKDTKKKTTSEDGGGSSGGDVNGSIWGDREKRGRKRISRKGAICLKQIGKQHQTIVEKKEEERGGTRGKSREKGEKKKPPNHREPNTPA